MIPSIIPNTTIGTTIPMIMGAGLLSPVNTSPSITSVTELELVVSTGEVDKQSKNIHTQI